MALIPSAGTFANVASDVDPSAWFIFNSNDNDGYTLTNYYNGQYVYCGAADNYTEASSSASESTAVYPVLNYNGHFGGISFPYTADGKGLSMNQNNASDLLSGNTVGAGMDGSIWILSEIEDVDTKVQACLATICGQFDAFA